MSHTDRGCVVVTELPDGSYKVEVCESVSPEGDAMNVYAAHVGVRELVTQVSKPLVVGGRSRFSTDPLEVFVDAQSGKLFVTSMHRWPTRA